MMDGAPEFMDGGPELMDGAPGFLGRGEMMDGKPWQVPSSAVTLVSGVQLS